MPKKYKYICIIYILFLLIIFPAFSSYTNDSNLKTVSTKHFKIIFPISCSFTANLIYENAESIYEMLTKRFDRDPELNIPVVITDKYKETNAFFSPYPSNHIVIYDFGNVSASLTYSKDSYLKIFEHELTHAFHINFRSPFWNFLSNIFGDSLNIAQIYYENNFFVEGLAVYSESQDNFGRLNDPFVMQILKQAKAENKFPSWTDVSSARDIYPYGEYNYIFGGAFLKYLSNTYGKEKLFEFFKQAEYFHISMPLNELFTKIFGGRPEIIWNKFKDSIPSVNINLKAYTVNNTKGVYNQTLYKNGSLYTYNTITGTVEKYTNMKRIDLLNIPSSDSYIDISDNSDILITHRDSENCKITLYNSESKQIISYKSDTDYFVKACFTYLHQIPHILAVSVKENYSFITLFNLHFKEITKKCLGYDEKIISLCSLGNEKVAFLISKSASEYIYILNTATLDLQVINTPDKISIKGLSYDLKSKKFYFSYANKDIYNPSLPSLGYIRENNNLYEFYISSQNVNGGIFYPSASEKNEVYFISDYTYGDLISKINLDSFIFDYIYSTVVTRKNFYDFTSSSTELSDFIINSKNYNPVSNLLRGTIYPLGPNFNIYELGLSYITWDPTETLEIEAGIGYNIKNKDLNINFTLNESVSNLIFSEGFYTSIPVNSIRNTSFNFNFTSSYRLNLRHNNEYFKLYNSLDTLIKNKKISINNLFILEYANLKNTGFNPFQNSGFIASLILENILPTVSLSYKTSKLIPITFKLSFSFLENNKYSLSETIDSTVFSWEIQKGIPYLYIYLKRLYLQLGINNTTYISHERLLNITSLACGINIDTAINLGYLSNITFTIGSTLNWNLTNNTQKIKFFINISR